MDGLKIFENKEFGQVRTVTIDEEPWFVGKDVAIALGYKDTDQALRKHVDSEDKLTRQFNGSDQKRTMTIINESGLYALIFGSKLESAKRFKHWVTSEVLPAIHKTGAYGLDKSVWQFMKQQQEMNKKQAVILDNVIDRLEALESQDHSAVTKHLEVLGKQNENVKDKIKVCDSQFSLAERLRELNGEFSYLSELYGIERRMVMHKVYRLLDMDLKCSLDVWLEAYKEMTGRREACTIHAVAYFDELYGKVMDLMEDLDKMDRIFE